MNYIGITRPWCNNWKKLCWPFVPGYPKLTTAVWYVIYYPFVLILFPLLYMSNCWMWGANLHKAWQYGTMALAESPWIIVL